ncbi:MAG: autotransporter-associated beta strand repeat-containing protein, partial [Verrucomicrobia bacterium]|nr:autotransporter-associated beta strand repeat-containing protein [Verrucomicrobiota bacterium]
QSITVSNSAKNYLFNGSGKISGLTGLTKNGNGTLTIGNSGNNDFSGDIALNAGTLIISNTSTIGNLLTGSGALTKNGNGTLTVSGDGSGFTGPVTVNGGTLSVLNTLSLATASGITVASGAALDIGNNNVGLGHELITVSGSGVGGSGAIVNSSGYGVGNGSVAVTTSFQNLAMAGDTTIGGPGRLDFRATTPTSDSDATLSTSGHGYKLTKVSVSTLQMSGVQIDSALGDIEVQGGILAFQGIMPSFGNPANNLTIFGGATVQFNAISTDINKSLALQDGAIFNNTGGNNIYDGPVTLQGNCIFNIGNGTATTFTNVIGGTGGSLTKITGNGSMTLNAASTYTGDTVISAGTLFLNEPASLASSRSITIGSGATLDVSGRLDQTLTLPNGQKLSGVGTLSGNLTNSPGSTVAPGATATAIGTLTVNGSATLNGTNVIKLVETNLTSDVLSVAGAVQFGGVLNLVTLAGSMHSGDAFTIFNAGGGFNGSFSSIIPATPGFGLTWDTNALATTGVLTVIGPGANTDPTNIVTAFDGSNLTLNWPMDHTGWRLQVQTNSLSNGLGGNWTDVAGSTATNQIIIPVSNANGSVFYRMVYP